MRSSQRPPAEFDGGMSLATESLKCYNCIMHLPSQQEAAPRARLTEMLALERNIVAVSGAMFLLGLGENLWR